MAVAVVRSQPLSNRPTRPNRPAPPPASPITGPELCGLACLLCHRRLPPTWHAARLLEVIEDCGGPRGRGRGRRRIRPGPAHGHLYGDDRQQRRGQA
jgi:hypothetical protein